MRDPDVVVFMVCKLGCPVIRCRHPENPGMEDPVGKPDGAFREIIC
jgi:arsenate reductase